MKIKSIFLVCLLASSLSSYCQTCLPNGIEFSSQLGIDNFLVNYPNCTQILGDVKITGSNISNLDGLSNLTTIGGDLTISVYQNPTSLSGLNNLVHIGGDIFIDYNSLTGLNCLNALTSANYISVNSNPGLVNLDCFSSLQTITGKFQIVNNPLLESLSSQGMLENIAADGELIISKNPKLTSVAGLQELTQVEGSITITDNESLTSLDSLIHLTSVGGKLAISLNPSLTDLSGLDNLTTVSTLDIFSHDSLGNLSHLSKLEKAGYLGIRKNPALVSLEGLSNLHRITDNFEITDNALLEKIGPFNFSDTLDGRVFIYGNPKLINIDALSNLTTIKKDIIVSYNESLTDFAGLNNLHTVGGLGIGGSPLLANLSDLNQLDSVETGLVIHNMPLLTSLEGLENLHYLGGTLYITDNQSLASLSGLENLRHAERLEIINNPSLASLSGIDSVEFAAEFTGYQIIIESNPLLSFCGIQSICNVMADHGYWTIYSDNAEGCNSQGEVYISCGLSDTDEKIDEAEIKIYPNPTPGVFVVEIETPKRFKAQVMDAMGRLVETVELFGGGVVDLSGEPEGMYFVRLLFDGQIVVRKVVKI